MSQTTLITTRNQITPNWLTTALSNTDALKNGHVAAVTVESSDERELSTIFRLTLTYSPDAHGSLPTKLVLKLVNTDMQDEFFGPSEVDYYTRDYLNAPDVPILHAYDALYSEEQRRYHILMDDLSDTHIAAEFKTPTLDYSLTLAEGFAAMHAHWWGKKRLADGHHPIHSPDHIMRFVDINRPGADHIINHAADHLKPHWPDMILDVYAHHPTTMIDRAQNLDSFTVIHADPNQSNILVPRNHHRPIYIIDRQPYNWSLTTWLGVYDLFYATGLRWDVEIRRQLETPMLQHYHAGLIQRGITDYSWEQLYEDYRLCAAMGIYVATGWCRGNFNQRTFDIWMPMLQRTLTAIDDLDGSNLW
jgi:hypothetical protein